MKSPAGTVRGERDATQDQQGKGGWLGHDGIAAQSNSTGTNRGRRIGLPPGGDGNIRIGKRVDCGITTTSASTVGIEVKRVTFRQAQTGKRDSPIY